MSSQHPWKLFARSIGSSGDLKSQQFSQAKCGGEADGNSSDEDQDIPTMAPPSLASGPRVSSQGSSLATGESSSRSLEGITPSGEATLRTDFESAGASEFLISRVEDMLMDHFYRVEASVFKVECGLKAQAEVCEEQQRYMHDVSERLSQVSADQRCDRARLQELRQDAARCKQTEGSSQASGFLCSSGNLDTKQSDRLLSDLRRDFDQQMARHEDRFITFEQTLRHCSAELADLRAELANAKVQTADHKVAAQPKDLAAAASLTASSKKDAGSARRGDEGLSNANGKGLPEAETEEASTSTGSMMDDIRDVGRTHGYQGRHEDVRLYEIRNVTKDTRQTITTGVQ